MIYLPHVYDVRTFGLENELPIAHRSAPSERESIALNVNHGFYTNDNQKQPFRQNQYSAQRQRPGRWIIPVQFLLMKQKL